MAKFGKPSKKSDTGAKKPMKSKPNGGMEKIDWKNIDWVKIISIAQQIFQLFDKSDSEIQEMMSTKGCPDEHLDTCCRCVNALRFNLEAVRELAECCADHCEEG